MLFLRNRGQSDAIALVTGAHKERADRKDSEMKSGASGLTEQSGDYGRGAVEESNFLTSYKQAASPQMLASNSACAHSQAIFQALLLCAPKTLGALRKQLCKEFESRIVIELPKEMTNRPLPDIATMLMRRSAAPD